MPVVSSEPSGEVVEAVVVAVGSSEPGSEVDVMEAVIPVDVVVPVDVVNP